MRDFITLNVSRLEVKSEADGIGEIEGYGAFYGNVDNVNDIIENGAFSEDIGKGENVRMLWNHDMEKVIGMWTSVTEDEKGLLVKGQINLNVEKGREAYSLVKQGAVKGLSIGYRVREDAIENGIRRIKKADLYEVSLTAFPVNEKATILSVKSENIKTEKRF